MSDKQKNSITCIEMGDQLFDTLRKEYNTLKNSEKFLAVDELAKQRRILGAQYGLLCEYYLLWTMIAGQTHHKSPNHTRLIPAGHRTTV